MALEFRRHGQDDREGDPVAPRLSAGFGLGGVSLGVG